MANGNTGNSRLAAKRIGHPNFIRAEARDADQRGRVLSPDAELVFDAVDSDAQAEANIPSVLSQVIAQALDADQEGQPDLPVITWNALLGGKVVIEEGGPGADGAEVVIIRDNDNTVVDTVFTDQNGEWSSSVPGGKTTDSDPEVYSIEVWYQDGPRRDPSTKLFNANNRPFIDTIDPTSENRTMDDRV